MLVKLHWQLSKVGASPCVVLAGSIYPSIFDCYLHLMSYLEANFSHFVLITSKQIVLYIHHGLKAATLARLEYLECSRGCLLSSELHWSENFDQSTQISIYANHGL